jgi:hypothetical protein
VGAKTDKNKISHQPPITQSLQTSQYGKRLMGKKFAEKQHQTPTATFHGITITNASMQAANHGEAKIVAKNRSAQSSAR